MLRICPLSVVTGLPLAILSGCYCDPGFIEPRAIEFAPQAELRAIAVGDLPAYYLVDAAGRVTILDKIPVGRRYELSVLDTVQVSSRPLVDVAVPGAGDKEVWVVDEAGTVHESLDAGRTWTSHPLDTELEPRGLVRHWHGYVIYGDDFVRARLGDEWFEPPVPESGWGPLRTATTLADTLVLSDGESLLLAEGDPVQFSWQRIEAPTEVLTFGGGINADLLVGGRKGRVLGTNAKGLGPNSMWTETQLGTDADIVAIENNSALTNAGELFDLDTLTMLDVGDANVGMASESGNFLIFGASGPLITTYYESCVRAL